MMNVFEIAVFAVRKFLTILMNELNPAAADIFVVYYLSIF